MIQLINSINIFVKHISPKVLMNNKALMTVLFEITSKDGYLGASLEESILRKSLDGILLISNNGVVEMCNPSVAAIFGYTPEQILGQPFFSFFPDEEAASIQNQMNLMTSGQSSDIFVGTTCVSTDQETVIPCSINLIAMKNHVGQINSFAAILVDISEQEQHEREAEQAKAKSESLLFEILPRDIVVKLNQGEKNISFSVPSATIIFVDIVRFSDYASSLNPDQIMGNLSLIFGEFDKCISKYPSMIKIKLIGDVYMAAAGLFDQTEVTPSHIEQTIKFGLDVLSALEEINMKLNSGLAVRIGVNTGGPVIAGVLGIDKPVFDIIGDPINVAARLQSTDIPGQIQISQAVYDKLPQEQYDIEERGEIFLKGKGKAKTYLVKNTIAFTQIFSTEKMKINDFLSSETIPQLNPSDSRTNVLSNASVPVLPMKN